MRVRQKYLLIQWTLFMHLEKDPGTELDEISLIRPDCGLWQVISGFFPLFVLVSHGWQLSQFRTSEASSKSECRIARLLLLQVGLYHCR